MMCNRYIVVIMDEFSSVETGFFIDLRTINVTRQKV